LGWWKVQRIGGAAQGCALACVTCLPATRMLASAPLQQNTAGSKQEAGLGCCYAGRLVCLPERAVGTQFKQSPLSQMAGRLGERRAKVLQGGVNMVCGWTQSGPVCSSTPEGLAPPADPVGIHSLAGSSYASWPTPDLPLGLSSIESPLSQTGRSCTVWAS
jgi:hypothetical protein